MSNQIEFIKTNDGSIGLFDKKVNDIYHSKTGAYTEAMEKFVNPINLNENYKDKDEINVLDICYGIGYNSKAILNYYRNKKFKIDCLEFNNELLSLSPIIKDNINNINLKLNLISELLKNDTIREMFFDVINRYITTENNEFFDTNIRSFIWFIISKGYISSPYIIKQAFLHNIYYDYISDSMNYNVLSNKYKEFILNCHIGDARKNIRILNSTYDVVFLDAFSPQKDPTLWTYDFLSEVVKRMHINSILVSYSKSTPFRNTLLNLNLHVGKTFINNTDMGTIASYNENFIKYPLCEYDYKLLSTKSGIMYRDNTLTDTPEQIISGREYEQKNSNLMSHTKFLKLFEKNP